MHERTDWSQLPVLGTLPRHTLLLCCCCVLLLCGCATGGTTPLELHPLRAAAGGTQARDAQVLQISAPMQDFLDQKILSQPGRTRRLESLLDAVLPGGQLEFRYHHDKTLTAAEAFNTRTGNCLAFANMVVALARASGFDARYREVSIGPQWSSEQDTYLLSKHVNVSIEHGNSEYIVDIDRRAGWGINDARLIDDDEASAQYYNNLAVQALLEDNLADAYGWLARALQDGPKLAYLWSNIGVIYSRGGQPADAEWAYQRALQLDSRQAMAMNNLGLIYARQNRHAALARLDRRIEHHRRGNPYYLLHLAEQAAAKQQYDESIKLLRKAIRTNASEHRFHFALATTLYRAGQTEAAENSFRTARAVAPVQVVLHHYNKPLQELASGGS